MAEPPETTPMEALESPTPSSSYSSSYLKSQPIPSSTPSPLPSSMSRLWRPAAQRNLRNQWSKLASHRQQWASSSSSGKSHANSLVNAHLSQRYGTFCPLFVVYIWNFIRCFFSCCVMGFGCYALLCC